MNHFTVNPELSNESQAVVFNDTYTVFVRRFQAPGIGRIVHLSIKRNDKQPLHDWRDLQWIKNQLVGTEVYALEIYPPEAYLVDTSNQYHLWALLDVPVLPFGFHERAVCDERATETPYGQAVQRPFAEHVRPATIEAESADFAARLAALQPEQWRQIAMGTDRHRIEQGARPGRPRMKEREQV